MNDVILTDDRLVSAMRALRSVDVEPTDQLVKFAKLVLEEVREIDLEDEQYPEDRVAEIADGAVPVYNLERLELVSSSPTLWNWEPQIEPSSNTPVDIAGVVLYEVATAIASLALQERQGDA